MIQFIAFGKPMFSGLDEDVALQRIRGLNVTASPGRACKLRTVGLHRHKGPLRKYWPVDINGPQRLSAPRQAGRYQQS